MFVTDEGVVTSRQSLKRNKQEPDLSEIIEASGERSPLENSDLVKTYSTGETKTTSDTVTEKKDTDDKFVAKIITTEKGEIESETSLTSPYKKNLSEVSESEIEQDLMKHLTLEVEASEGTWISISVDGNEAKDIRLSTDEIHQWEAKKEYILTLGNTNAVRILLNGREIETNRTHQLLTDWVIDKSFLP